MNRLRSSGAAANWVSSSPREALAPIDHAFTHFDLRLNPLRVRCTPASGAREADDRLWYALKAPPRVGLPQPIMQLFQRLRLDPGA